MLRYNVIRENREKMQKKRPIEFNREISHLIPGKQQIFLFLNGYMFIHHNNRLISIWTNDKEKKIAQYDKAEQIGALRADRYRS